MKIQKRNKKEDDDYYNDDRQCMSFKYQKQIVYQSKLITYNQSFDTLRKLRCFRQKKNRQKQNRHARKRNEKESSIY